MREAVLIVVVALICLAGLLKPRVGILGYVWFALLRPDVLAYASPTNSYSLSIAVSTLIGSLRMMGRAGRLFSNPISLTLLILQLPILLSVALAVRPDLSYTAYWLYVRIIIMALLITLLVDDLSSLRTLVMIMAGSLGFVGLKFGLFGALHGGARIGSGYDNGMLSGNNEVGMALAMVLPLCYHMVGLVRLKFIKVITVGIVFATVAGIILTHSRGAALGLAAVALMLMWQSSRRIVALMVVLVLIGPAVYLAGDSYIERLSTLRNPEQEGSAASRLEMSKIAFRMWTDYPFFGVGFGRENFRSLVHQYDYSGATFVAHNTYTQVLADSGMFAFLLHVGLLFGTIYWLGKSRSKCMMTHPHLAAYPGMLQMALVAYAVTSTFGSRENFDFYYMLLMTSASWYHVSINTMVADPAHDDPLESELSASPVAEARAEWL